LVFFGPRGKKGSLPLSGCGLKMGTFSGFVFNDFFCCCFSCCALRSSASRVISSIKFTIYKILNKIKQQNLIKSNDFLCQKVII